MKCLVTGCAGFIGSHLAEYLLSLDQTVYGVVRQASLPLGHLSKVHVKQCDLLDKKCVRETILETRPQRIFHLASQTLIKPSWQDPELTIRTNVLGTLYLLNAVRDAGISPTIVIVCSSGEYAATNDGKPIGEDHRLEPSSPYALSKLAQDHLAALYGRAYGMNVMRLRPFSVIGPRKSGDVCSDFARDIVAIERGQQDCLSVGNLEAVRDFLDVRDAVAAFWLIAERGQLNEVYNICSGKGYKIREILELLISLANTEIRVRQDPDRIRFVDEPIRIGCNEKLRRLGWEPKIPLDQTLSDVLAYWRSKL